MADIGFFGRPGKERSTGVLLKSSKYSDICTPVGRSGRLFF